jgi:general secretion pathway protein A
VTPDPRFLYFGQSHREALASLYYGIQADRGFVALIARPGLGKTTLAFQLLEKLQPASRAVFLSQTQCNSKELLHHLLHSLGVETEGMELVSMHNKLNEILCREVLAGRRLIVAIDEAQNLDPSVLETVRLLSNFESSQSKLLQILLIGQPLLAEKLDSPELEQLEQRISVFARLEPFDSEDTARYIARRLQVAGYEGSPLFTPEALEIIAVQSEGIPRKINGLCFSALSLACAMGREKIDAGMMGEIVADRDVEPLYRSRTARRVLPSHAASRPALTYYPAKPRWSFNRWVSRAANFAGCTDWVRNSLLFLRRG